MTANDNTDKDAELRAVLYDIACSPLEVGKFQEAVALAIAVYLADERQAQSLVCRP